MIRDVDNPHGDIIITMTTINGSTKGNNGRRSAALRHGKPMRLEHKLLVTLGCCVTFLSYRYLFGGSNNDMGGRSMMMMRLGKRTDDGDFDTRRRRGGGGGGGGPINIRRAMTDPNYDKYEKRQAQLILSAQANLIDIT